MNRNIAALVVLVLSIQIPQNPRSTWIGSPKLHDGRSGFAGCSADWRVDPPAGPRAI